MLCSSRGSEFCFSMFICQDAAWIIKRDDFNTLAWPLMGKRWSHQVLKGLRVTPVSSAYRRMFMQLEGKVGQIKRKNRFLSRLLPLLFSLVYTDATTIFRPAFNILFELNFAAKLHRTQSVAWSSSTWHGVWKPERVLRSSQFHFQGTNINV